MLQFRNQKVEKRNEEIKINEELSESGVRSTDGINAFGSSYYRQSYSSISSGAYHPVEVVESKIKEKLSEYDTYIFHDFPRGAQAGTFLHEMFEITNFLDDESWSYSIEQMCKKHGATFEKKV